MVTRGDGPRRRPGFATTHWSIVVAAGHGESRTSHLALTALCEQYWYPLYAYVRRHGFGPEDAQDLTQEFFARLLEKNDLRRAEPARGRFLSFLLGAFKHFLWNQRDRARAKKRGGAVVRIPLDLEMAEGRYSREGADESTPERIYERQWALTLLNRVMGRLRLEAIHRGKGRLFDCMQMYLSGDTDLPSYAETAASLGIREGAMKVAVHRLRRRFQKLIREEVGKTVATPGDIDLEIRYLLRSVSSAARE